MRFIKLPSQERLREVFDYKEGRLVRKLSAGNQAAGDVAGTSRGTDAYRVVCVDRIYAKEHRLIWVYFNGEIPDGMIIDHIDMDKTNNKIENLRLVTYSQNARRMRTKKTVRGVYYNKALNLWCARICTNPYETVVLGCSRKREVAERLRLDAEPKHGYE